MKANNYYAVEFSLYNGKPVYIELDRPVSDYHTAVDLAMKKAIKDGDINSFDDIKCEREVFVSMK